MDAFEPSLGPSFVQYIPMKSFWKAFPLLIRGYSCNAKFVGVTPKNRTGKACSCVQRLFAKEAEERTILRLCVSHPYTPLRKQCML